MQGIESKKHQNTVKIIDQFEGLSTVFGHLFSEEYDAKMRESAEKLKDTYEYYLLLIGELQQCILSYKDQHDALQKMMYPCIRKMHKEQRKKKRS